MSTSQRCADFRIAEIDVILLYVRFHVFNTDVFQGIVSDSSYVKISNTFLQIVKEFGLRALTESSSSP